eukprot:102875-Chlamydomonas_euryale.AAC.1
MPLGFGSLPQEGLAATDYRQVLGGIGAEPGAEKLRPLRYIRMHGCYEWSQPYTQHKSKRRIVQ